MLQGVSEVEGGGSSGGGGGSNEQDIEIKPKCREQYDIKRAISGIRKEPSKKRLNGCVGRCCSVARMVCTWRCCLHDGDISSVGHVGGGGIMILMTMVAYIHRRRTSWCRFSRRSNLSIARALMVIFFA